MKKIIFEAPQALDHCQITNLKNLPLYNFPLALAGGVCLLIITFHSIVMNSRQMFEFIILLAMCVFIICMWVMVKQVRKDILDKTLRRVDDAERELFEDGETSQDLQVDEERMM